MPKIKFITYIFLVIFACDALGQNKEYAKEIIETLCAPAYFGRGYVNHGDSLAAEFLRKEFKKHGAIPVEEDYFQYFVFPVNSFPGNVDLALDKKQLNTGEEFLVAPSSAGGSGNAKAITLSIQDVLNDTWLEILQSSKHKALVFDLNGMDALNKNEKAKIHEFISYLKFESNIQPELVLINYHKLIPWSVSTHQASRPVFLLTSENLPQDYKKVYYDVDSKYYEKYRSKNVIGYIKGSQTPDSTIFITAHYDHLGAMGPNTYFPGANDNASGIAMMLNLMEYYSQHQPEYSVVFAAFGAEEAGLIGSKYYVEHPLLPLDKIKFLINIDLIGTGDEGITVVNGKQFEKQFELLQTINQSEKLLPKINARGEACNSDHCFFYKRNVPCFFIYALGGIQAYHDIYDVPDTLPLTEYDDIFHLIRSFIGEQ